MARFVTKLVLVLATVSTLAACGGISSDLRGHAPATGATAHVEGATDSATHTTKLELTMAFLQPPSDLRPGGTGFAVWARRDDDAAWQRLGMLKYDAETRQAELADVTVAETSFELAVTVESEVAPAEPSNTVVFSQALSD